MDETNNGARGWFEEAVLHPRTRDEMIEWEFECLTTWWDSSYSAFGIPIPKNVDEWRYLMICAGFDWRGHIFFNERGEGLRYRIEMSGTCEIGWWVENQI